jgi:hypothetical protein
MAIILCLLICDIVNDIQRTRHYREYIDSIKVGDIFEPKFIEDLNMDPFDEVIDYTEYNKVIIDIKKNNKGETWVKYRRLKNGGVEFTEEIHRFVENQKRVKQSEI